MFELKLYPEIKRVIVAAFPNYKKKKAMVSVFKGEVNVNSYWSEGSRSEYGIVELATMSRKLLPTPTHPYFDVANRGLAGTGNRVLSADHVGNITLKELPSGYALVSAGTFCGKPATTHVYFNVNDITTQLDGAPVDLLTK